MHIFTQLRLAKHPPLYPIAQPPSPSLARVSLSAIVLSTVLTAMLTAVLTTILSTLAAGLLPSRVIAAPVASPLPQPSEPSNPAPADLPEEVLRTEIITEARSPIDGKPMTAQEYAELLVEINQANQVEPQVSPKVRQTVGLLKLRKFLKTVLPLLPIK